MLSEGEVSLSSNMAGSLWNGALNMHRKVAICVAVMEEIGATWLLLLSARQSKARSEA